MSGTTPNRGYPYPTDTDPIDVAGDIQQLAEAVDLDNATTDDDISAINVNIANLTAQLQHLSVLAVGYGPSIDTPPTQVSTPQTITGMNVTFNAVAGRRYKFDAGAVLSTTANGGLVTLQLVLEAGATDIVLTGRTYQVAANEIFSPEVSWVSNAIPTGSQSVRFDVQGVVGISAIGSFSRQGCISVHGVG